jgi:hypothetical protein
MRGAHCIAAVAIIASSSRPLLAESAIDAIKHLPAGEAARIARIEGRDGAPEPERWYILTQDPATDNGVHEFVVANGEIVASRSLSQFADSLKPDDILGAGPLTVDSTQAAKIAQDYAAINGIVISTISYDLRKEGAGAAPLWTISCLDDKGVREGAIIITAGKGSVVSHEGFALVPAPAATPGSVAKTSSQPRFDTYAKPEVATAANSTPASAAGATAGGGKRAAKKPETGVAKTMDNVGRTLHKYLLPF